MHFIPGYDDRLISGSVDGLMCLFDTGGDINDDDQMVSVCQKEFLQSIFSVYFI